MTKCTFTTHWVNKQEKESTLKTSPDNGLQELLDLQKKYVLIFAIWSKKKKAG